MSLAERVPSIRDRLRRIYGARAADAERAIEAELADLVGGPAPTPPADRWTERDVALITYADQLRNPEGGVPPLAALRAWLIDNGLDRLLSVVHLLPFFPWTSDDGFSVVDYLAVDPEAGRWDDVADLGDRFDLMFDLVLNHVSAQGEWFQAYLRGEAPYDRFFIEADPSLDYSGVTRPRSLPLLTPVSAAAGGRHVWTTFSADQVDLNYAEPVVLARMLRVLVEYARRGARIVRLDAIAYLWKRLGTSCIHLDETHEVVKLMRDVLAAAAPGALVLTETNVPHAENVSYFGAVDPATGEGDEAHMVYQFSLPPLLLEAFLSGDASALKAWLRDLAPPPPGCTFFNFTASHDGVGVRPLEGLVSDERFARFVEAVDRRGAIVNTKRNPDGSDTPYELCVAYFSALAPDPPDDELHVRRFLASQAVMLALRGMPAVYFHSLVGTPNDTAGAEASGVARRINRRKYDRAELDAALAPGTVQRRVFDGMRGLIGKRIAEPALHPDAPQRVVDLGSGGVLAFERTSLDGARRVLAVTNVTDEPQGVDLGPSYDGAVDLLANASPVGPRVELKPAQGAWFSIDCP